MLSNRIMQASGFASALFAGMPGNNAAAVEPMDSNELLTSCQNYAASPASEDGALCRGYLQGLLSSDVTDNAENHQSALVSRATQTRAAHLVTRVQDNSTGQKYCLPDDVSVDAIIERLVSDSQGSEFNNLPADVLVTTTLSRNFPCSPTE